MGSTRALHRAFPQTQGWEHSHRYGVSSDRDYNRKETQRFGSLKTAGLFPVLENGCWLFPSPLDIVPSKDPRLQLLRPLRPDIHSGRDNLPPPLSYSLGSPCAPSKEGAEPWWSRAAYEAYLRNKRPATDETKTDVALLAGEWITGIRIDPETETTGQGEAAGQIYSAEYLRLRPEVRMGFVATLPVRLNGSTDNVQECIGKLLGENGTIVVGGQRRVCSVAPLQTNSALGEIFPSSIQIHGERVKWVLLTPAIFPAIPAGQTKNGHPIKSHPGGWLPTWVDPETGKVKLLADGPGITKAKRLRAPAGREIDVSLVATRIPKPVVITGWSERLHALKPFGSSENKGAKPTLLAVPAGAVYYAGRRKRALDDENPVPNYFPAVEEGSEFGFAVLLNREPDAFGIEAETLLQQARSWVELAIREKGVGAKTAAGYGWFRIRSSQAAQSAREGKQSDRESIPAPGTSSEEEELIAKWRGKLATTGNFTIALPEIAAVEDEAMLRRIFEAVIPEGERRRSRKNQPYWQSFTSGRHGQAGKKILERLGLGLS
jgi:hypothetical protein